LNPKGRVLLVGAETALMNELTPSMTGREYELAAAPDARAAALKISTETFAAVVRRLSRRSAPAPTGRLWSGSRRRSAGIRAGWAWRRRKSLSPATPSALRRVAVGRCRAIFGPGPFLPARSPWFFLVEPTLFITQGLQGALRRPESQFLLDGQAWSASSRCLREQVARAAEAKAKAKAHPPKSGGFWERLSGSKDAPPEDVAVFGHVAVGNSAASVPRRRSSTPTCARLCPTRRAISSTTIDLLRASVHGGSPTGRPAMLPARARRSHRRTAQRRAQRRQGRPRREGAPAPLRHGHADARRASARR